MTAKIASMESTKRGPINKQVVPRAPPAQQAKSALDVGLHRGRLLVFA
tara:strand:+ start:4484 stop:4627 length:144 start_codon:yes stop_codon:yes gene_type:complete